MFDWLWSKKPEKVKFVKVVNVEDLVRKVVIQTVDTLLDELEKELEAMAKEQRERGK